MSGGQGNQGNVIKQQKWHYVKTYSAAKARELLGKAGSVPVRRRDEEKGLPTFAIWAGDAEPAEADEPGVGENPGIWVEEAKTSAPAPPPVIDVDAKDPEAN